MSIAVIVVFTHPRGPQAHKSKNKIVHVAAVQKSRRIHGNIRRLRPSKCSSLERRFDYPNAHLQRHKHVPRVLLTRRIRWKHLFQHGDAKKLRKSGPTICTAAEQVVSDCFSPITLEKWTLSRNASQDRPKTCLERHPKAICCVKCRQKPSLEHHRQP